MKTAVSPVRALFLVLGIGASSLSLGYVNPEGGPNGQPTGFKPQSGHHGASVGRKIYRPEIAPALEEAAFSASKFLVYRDAENGQVRKIEGDLGLRARSLELSDMSELCLSYVQDHPEFFESVSPDDLAINRSQILLNKQEQFLTFDVTRDGLPVEDARLVFRFLSGKLVQVVTHTLASIPTDDGMVSSENLIRQHFLGAAVRVSRYAGDAYRLVSSGKGQQMLHRVRRYEASVNGQQVVAAWDHVSGKVFDLTPRIYYANGVVTGSLYPRNYKDAAEPLTLPAVSVTPASGSAVFTDENGNFELPLDVKPELKGLSGKKVVIKLKSGTEIKEVATQESGSYKIHIERTAAAKAYEDKRAAQLMVYYHTDKIARLARKYIDAGWLDTPLTANVNLTDTCNAHWDGSTINFYSADSQCANTGLLADVIYHEWGHGLDDAYSGITDGAYSEGFGDIMSLIMTHSAELGDGFFVNAGGIRNLEADKKYPDDKGEVHDEGLIIGTTFYDLLVALKNKHGEDQAAEILRKFAFKMITTTSSYTEVMDALFVLDDDDADLSNGTPNMCLIRDVFKAHGLAQEDIRCQMGVISLGELREIEGNHNGFMDPGETFGFAVRIANNTGGVLSGISAQLRPSSGLAIINGTVSFPEIAPGQQSSTDADLSFKIDSAIACGSDLAIGLELSGGGRSASLQQTLAVGRMQGSPENLSGDALPLSIASETTVESAANFSSAQWANGTKVKTGHVKIAINHSYIGDLLLDLVGPDARTDTLLRATGPGKEIRIDRDISDLVKGRSGSGRWVLRVKDQYRGDEGTLTEFKLKLVPDAFVCENF